jgi:putative heme-binding domain-containing protein
VEAILRQESLTRDQRAMLAQAAIRFRSATAIPMLLRVLREVASGAAVPMAAAVGGSGEGADALLRAIADGRASSSLLSERSVQERILSVRPQFKDRLPQGNAADPDAKRRFELVAHRQADFRKSAPDAKTGARLFQSHCMPCHSMGGQGGQVGPQLDGVGHRGVERLCEDVLDPNRNVDRIFRYSVVSLQNGDVLNLLFRRDEGEQRVYVNAGGQEQRIARSDIREVRESATSLMPDNFAEALSPSDFNHLLRFLLMQQIERP